MHTVKRAAELVGISPEILRMWERRYGIVTPTRTEGGYRLYDDAALRRLTTLKTLVDAGWRPAQAAQRILDTAGDPDLPRPRATDVMGDTTALSRLAGDFDPARLDAALDEAFTMSTFEDVVDHWLMPSLAELGSAWRAGSVSVAGEHFVSASVQRRLAASYDAAAPAASGPTVAVGLARGSRHELGVLAFATAARRAGLATLYVGADLPPEEWAATAEARSAAAAVLAVPCIEDVPAVRETLAALVAARPHLATFVGGGHQGLVGDRARELGHAVGAAAQLVADLLGA